jgi:hypothetical protein
MRPALLWWLPLLTPVLLLVSGGCSWCQEVWQEAAQEQRGCRAGQQQQQAAGAGGQRA